MKARLVAAVASAAILLGPAAALASDCTDSDREADLLTSELKPSAHTSIHNEMKLWTLLVEIYRGSDQKVQRFVKPGESTGYLAKFAANGGHGTIRVAAHPQSTDKVTDCSYEIKWDTRILYWSLPKGQDAVCAVVEPAAVDCQKNFHQGKVRWNTSFTFKDPS